MRPSSCWMTWASWAMTSGWRTASTSRTTTSLRSPAPGRAWRTARRRTSAWARASLGCATSWTRARPWGWAWTGRRRTTPATSWPRRARPCWWREPAAIPPGCRTATRSVSRRAGVPRAWGATTSGPSKPGSARTSRCSTWRGWRSRAPGPIPSPRSSTAVRRVFATCSSRAAPGVGRPAGERRPGCRRRRGPSRGAACRWTGRGRRHGGFVVTLRASAAGTVIERTTEHLVEGVGRSRPSRRRTPQGPGRVRVRQRLPRRWHAVRPHGPQSEGARPDRGDRCRLPSRHPASEPC